MAEYGISNFSKSDIQQQDLISNLNDNCVNCIMIKEQYDEVLVELKSFCLITNMLQKKIKVLKSQQDELKSVKGRHEQYVSQRESKV
jgi:hypothetical protein